MVYASIHKGSPPAIELKTGIPISITLLITLLFQGLNNIMQPANIMWFLIPVQLFESSHFLHIYDVLEHNIN